METLKNWKTWMIATSAATLMWSCAENEDTQIVEGESQVTISSTVGNSTDDPNARISNLVYGNFEITDVTISIDNLKMMLKGQDKDKGKNKDKGKDKPSVIHIKEKDPVVLTLVEDGQIYVAPVASGLAYNGVYGKVTFDLVKAMDVPEEDDIYGNSVVTKATWFGVPAVMYIDLEDEVVFQFNQGLEVEGSQELLLTFFMDKFLEGVSPTLVSDGNLDGLIEVGPNNEDGNGEAYEAILANIKEALVFKNGDFKKEKK